jgi:LCP family protein required for cell wall assembly
VKSRYEFKREKKRKKPSLKKVLIILCILILPIMVYAGYVTLNTLQAANSAYEELGRGEKSKLRTEKVEIMNDPVSILLMGVETYSSGGEVGRADSLIVVTLNPSDQSMKMLSIPRDTRVTIPGEDKKDKINHSFVFGGKDLTIDTVEDFLGIPIDYYANVSFDGFKHVINEVNGVTVDVPFDFWEDTDAHPKKRIHFTEGEMTLNGEEALAYARMRKRDPRGDFGRNERQQQILTAAIDKLASPTTLFKVHDIAEHIGESVETNVSVRKALSFQNTYTKLNSTNIEKLMLHGEDQTINGIYYFVPNETNLVEVQTKLKAHLSNQTHTVENNREDNNL